MNQVEALRQRLLVDGKMTWAQWLEPYCATNDGSCKIAVVGEILRGKSTWINQLLGQNLLPVDVIPSNCVVTLKYRPQQQIADAEGNLLTGVSIGEAMEENSSLTLCTPNRNLKELDISITEYPGLGRVRNETEFLALHEIWGKDGVVLVVSAEQLLSITESNFMEYFCKYSSAKRLLVWISKADRLNSIDFQRITSYARDKMTTQFPEVTWWIGAERVDLPEAAEVQQRREQCFSSFATWVRQVRHAAALQPDALLENLKERLLEERQAALKTVAQAEQKQKEQYKSWLDQRDSCLTELDLMDVELQRRRLAAMRQADEEIKQGFARMKKDLICDYRYAENKIAWCGGQTMKSSWNQKLDAIAERVDQTVLAALDRDTEWLNGQLQTCRVSEKSYFQLTLVPRDAPVFQKMQNSGAKKKQIRATVAGGTIGVFVFLKIIGGVLMALTQQEGAAEFGSMLNQNALKAAAAALLIGVLVDVLKERALTEAEEEQNGAVEQAISDALARIECPAREQARKRIEELYSSMTNVLTKEKEEIYRSYEQETPTKAVDQKEVNRIDALLYAVENC